MPRSKCTVCGYNNRAIETGISRHRFPFQKPELLQQWLRNLGMEGFTPNKTSKVCSIHFLPNCFKEDVYAKYGIHPPKTLRTLKPDAVPTEWLHQLSSPGKSKKKTPNSVARKVKAKNQTKISKKRKRSNVKKSVTGAGVKSPPVQVKIEPPEPETSGCDLYSIIKTEPVIEPISENAHFGENVNVREESLQFHGSGDTTPRKIFTVPSVDQSIQVSTAEIITATRSMSTQTDFDPSSLIVLDPSRMIVLDPSQVSGLNASQLPGFDPSQITGFNPSQLPGYDPSQEYRAVYVNWKEPISQEPAHPDPVEPLNENIPQSSGPEQQATNIQSDQSPQHKLISSSENVMANVEEIVRFTENIQEVIDKAQEAIEFLHNSCYGNHVRLCGFILILQKMVDAANNNILNTIKQLADTTRQQQTQFLDLAGFVRKIQIEQSEMEEQMLRFRKLNLTIRYAARRKRKYAHEIKETNLSETFSGKRKCKLTPKKKKSKLRKTNCSLEISKKDQINRMKEQNVKFRKGNGHGCAKEEYSKGDKPELCFTPDGVLQTAERLEFQNIAKSKDVDKKTNQKDKCYPVLFKCHEEIRKVKIKSVTVCLTKRHKEKCEMYNGLNIFS